MSFYNNKKVLITGGSGMIGRPLIKMLTERGAKVRVTSLDEPIKNSESRFNSFRKLC